VILWYISVDIYKGNDFKGVLLCYVDWLKHLCYWNLGNLGRIINLKMNIIVNVFDFSCKGMIRKKIDVNMT
jgi:hypothetical protein